MRPHHLVRGLAALVALVALVVGIPLALLLLGGDPLPAHLPSLSQLGDDLLHRDEAGTLFMGLLVVVGWVAWLCFTLSVATEIASRIGGRPAWRLPGLGRAQRFAATLVTAVALTFASPVAAMAAAPPVPVVAVQHAVAPVAHSGAAAATHVQAARQQYVVRHGDYLGFIAERFGGTFESATDLARANHIADPNLILPGWRITLPSGATDLGSRGHATGHVVEHHDPSTNPIPGTGGNDGATGQPSAGPTGGATGGAVNGHTATPTPGHSTAPTHSTAPGHSTAPTHRATPTLSPQAPKGAAAGGNGHSNVGPIVADVLEASGTLAAVVALALVGMRHREQIADKVRGGIAALAGVAAPPREPEPRLMDPTDADAMIRLDKALRLLADRVQDWPVDDVPQVAGVWLDTGTITMLLADAARPAPAPFIDDENGWLLRAGIPVTADPSQLAPLPALVTVGGRADQHVLLDVEYLRVLGIGGDQTQALNLLRYLVVELCHNAWADDVRVTIAGFGNESDALVSLDRDRIRTRSTVLGAVDEFGRRLSQAVAQPDDIHAPDVLVIARPSPSDMQAIAALERDLMRSPGVGLSLVVGPTPAGHDVGRYQMHVGKAGDLHIGFLGDAVVPAAALPASLVPDVAQLLGIARSVGDRSPLQLARLESQRVRRASAGRRGVRMAGQVHRNELSDKRALRRELRDLTSGRHARPA